MKLYKGLFDSLYKKWELYLFRLFQIEKFIENLKKFTILSPPPIEEVLNQKGYEGYIRIPPNPFFLSESDMELYYMVFDDLQCSDLSDRNLHKLFVDIWNRIGFVKEFLGITRNTRYCGEEQAEKRLLNEIEVFLRYPESCPSIYSVVFGSVPEDKSDEYFLIINAFREFLKDRDPVGNGRVKSYDNYWNV